MNVLRTSFVALGCTLLLGGCTPEIRDYARSQWHDIKTHDYGATFGDATGFNEKFPDFAEMARREDSKMCVHGDSENRVATMNGVEDEVYYRRCTLQPYTTNSPARFAGK